MTPNTGEAKFLATLMLAASAIIPLGFVWAFLLHPKSTALVRLAGLLPIAGMLCLWLAAFCFMAPCFTGGKTKVGHKSLAAPKLYYKGETFVVPPRVWEFQRWCDRNESRFFVAGVATMLIGMPLLWRAVRHAGNYVPANAIA